ncbi:hypothetical protein B0H12DRAFT_1078746 [Mycena haematopus]|nr:hypothetical protein B0H12DRAFT_1078746 [Mycena haematopus]
MFCPGPVPLGRRYQLSGSALVVLGRADSDRGVRIWPGARSHVPMKVASIQESCVDPGPGRSGKTRVNGGAEVPFLFVPPVGCVLLYTDSELGLRVLGNVCDVSDYAGNESSARGRTRSFSVAELK